MKGEFSEENFARESRTGVERKVDPFREGREDDISSSRSQDFDLRKLNDD